MREIEKSEHVCIQKENEEGGSKNVNHIVFPLLTKIIFGERCIFNTLSTITTI